MHDDYQPIESARTLKAFDAGSRSPWLSPARDRSVALANKRRRDPARFPDAQDAPPKHLFFFSKQIGMATLARKDVCRRPPPKDIAMRSRVRRDAGMEAARARRGAGRADDEYKKGPHDEIAAPFPTPTARRYAGRQGPRTNMSRFRHGAPPDLGGMNKPTEHSRSARRSASLISTLRLKEESGTDSWFMKADGAARGRRVAPRANSPCSNCTRANIGISEIAPPVLCAGRGQLWARRNCRSSEDAQFEGGDLSALHFMRPWKSAFVRI